MRPPTALRGSHGAPPSPSDQLWTTAQVAEFLQVSDRTVRRLVQEERLRPAWLGRLPRFRPADVRDLARPE